MLGDDLNLTAEDSSDGKDVCFHNYNLFNHSW